MAAFDRARVAELLQLAGTRLTGEWLLVGGAAAASWFSPERTTEDLDLIGLGGSQGERFALMQLAADAAIPIEAVNSAADFFVRRIPDWREQLVELHRGSAATIYRPNPTLFLLLKLARLTETDLSDCMLLIEHVRATGDELDRDRVMTALDALPGTTDAALVERRARLRTALT
jgi:hypothetical protein